MRAGSAPRIAMVAGEGAGDALGAHLIEAVRGALPDAHFCGVGGSRMQAAGLELWYLSEDLAGRGHVQGLRRLPRILNTRRELAAKLIAQPPHLFVGVDALDFNLGLEEQLRAAGIQTVQYMMPQPWAWRGRRLHQLKRAASRVLALFPFELTLLEQAGIPASFVGHLLADQLPLSPDREAAREQFRLPATDTVIALLPGSRERELEYMSDLFVLTAKLLHRQARHAHFLVPLQSRPARRKFEDAVYRNAAQDLPIAILFGHAQMAMTAADGVLLASGPDTLEAALLKRTMVVTYKLSPYGYRKLRRAHPLPYVALPNILAGRFVVPELLQDDATPENLSQALLNQVADKVVRGRQERAFLEIHRTLQQGTGERIVEALLPMLSRRQAPLAPSARAADAFGA
jgi:lipid-A-disaccharide synthase